ncbi:hypothetical protein K502DRAFT_323246 [Neoconidiobolus thromboides FSU 785]|nr:hypothetical protein K502DRAFT_323246 [Neoconidiobolus thromboides FSU 785]
MALVAFIPIGPKIDVNSDMTPHRNQLIFLSLVDVIGNGLVTAGMFRIGSGLYQVISALLIPFIALLSRFVLNRTLNFLQWWGILAIFVGLTFNTFVSHITSTIQFEVDSNMIGILLTTSGIFLYAGCYVYTEKLLSKPNPPPPILVCQWTGIYGIIVCVFFHLFYSLPSRYSKLSVLFSAAYSQTGTILEQEQASVSLSQGIGGFILLTLSALAHNSSYYILISSSGAVSTGIIQALRTVGVLVCSAFLYCGHDPHQCLSPAKFGSAFIVVLGVFIFSVFG